MSVNLVRPLQFFAVSAAFLFIGAIIIGAL